MDGSCGMGDESIHDHPNPFQSYIVAGGYEHELYKVVEDRPAKFPLFDRVSLTPEQLWTVYQSYMSAVVASNKFKFSISKDSKSVSYEGIVRLLMTGTERTKAGDIVNIDSAMVHRVSKYHTVPGEKTLSLNIVRAAGGKGVTNIYLPEQKGAAVKTEREDVSREEAATATDEMISIISRTFGRR